MRYWLQAASLAAAVFVSSLSAAQEKTLTMSGIVSDAKSRNPIEGARVTAVGNKATSDATTDTNGSFILTFRQDVGVGDSVLIRVEKSGYKPFETWRAVSSAILLQVSLQAIRSAPSASRAPAGQAGDKTSPIDHLSKLGWAIQPAAGNSLRFSDVGSHISMRQSAKYFCAVDRPFSVEILFARSLDGVSGLRDAKHLTKLSLGGQELRDISELRYLRNLGSLAIGADISDLSPLQGLTNLQELSLGSATMRDLTPIQGLRNITTLSIGGAQVSDLSPINNFRALRVLNLDGSPKATDLSPLRDIDTLEELRIGGRQVPGLPVLRHLKILYLTDSEPVDLSPIGELGQLEKLYIYGPIRLNLAPLRRLTRLSDLSLMEIGDLNSLMQVEDIAAIGELHALRRLALWQVLLTNLSFARGLHDLTELTLVNTPVSDITGIEQAAALSVITFSNTRVFEISPLLGLANLTELSVPRTPARSDILTMLEQRGVKLHR